MAISRIAVTLAVPERGGAGTAGPAASFVLVDDVPTFLVVATVDAVLGAAALTLRGALIAAIVAPDRRVHAFAVLRTAASTGIAAGVAVAGLVLALDTRQAYAALALGRACTYLVSAGLHFRLPRLSSRPAPDREDANRGALQDLPYLGVMATRLVLLLAARAGAYCRHSARRM